jgi:hypothetical protein
LATDNIGGHGTCPPVNQVYTIYNYYCQADSSDKVERTLNQVNCLAVRSAPIPHCNTVEAFIDTMVVHPPGTIYPPVFYRCYWVNIPNTLPDDREIIQFEWSASSEYIEWYVTNIRNGGPNSVDTLINAQGGTVPTPSGVLVPLLKVTNHSPSPF